MATIDIAFYRLAMLAGVSLAVLAIGSVFIFCWRRPIERLRCIEATLIAAVAACLLQQLPFVPRISLGMPPQNTPPAQTAAIGPVETHSEADQRSYCAQPGNVSPPIAIELAAPASGVVGISPAAPTKRTAESQIERSTSGAWAPVASCTRCALLLVSVIGAGWSLLRIAIGLMRLRRLLARCAPAPEQFAGLIGEIQSPHRRRVSIFSSPRIEIPLTFGVRKPTIVLPAAMIRTSAMADIRHCLAHEWSHIRNRDVVVWWAVQLLQPIFWFQPLYWLLRRELRLAQDQVADHFAASQAPDRTRYAELLLELAMRRRGVQPNMVLTMSDGRSNLFRRIQLLLSAEQRWVAACRWWTISAATVVLMVVSGVLGAISIGRAVEFAAPQSLAADPTAAAVPPVQAAVPTEDPSKAVIIGTAVDQSGRPVAGAKLSSHQWERPDATAVSSGDGQFRLQLDLPMANYKMVYAASSDGKLLGRSRTEFMAFGRVVPCHVVLKPAISTRVKVVDAEGAAVSGAMVVSDDDQVWMSAHATTDDDGAAMLHVPADAEVRVVLGFKARVGLDYFENFTTSESNFGPVPTEVKLALDGAQPARVRVMDSAGKPLGGISVLPWLISKTGKISMVNAACLQMLPNDALPRSGFDGIAVCDWLPSSFRSATFDPIDPRFNCPNSPRFDVATKDVLKNMRMLRRVKARGRVTAADGSPAAGILVQAEGCGYTNHYCREYARTAADGTYSIDVYPEQEYIYAVVDPDRAAANITGITMHENQPRSGLDFRLGPGTIFEGRLTSGSKAAPIAGATLSVVAVGPPLPESLMRDIKGQHANLCRWAETDADGRYKLRLGRGNYQIAAPDWKYHDFTVGAEPTITRDFHLPRLPRGPVNITVRNADGSPAAGVTLRSNAFGEGRTDAAGHFHIDRSQDAALVYAVDSDGRNGAVVALGPDDKHAELTLQPAVVAIGRSIAADGRPRANCIITAVMRMAGGGANAPTANQQAYAKLDGSFRLTGLVDGTQCDIYVCTSARCGIRPVKKIEIHGPGPINLGNLPISPNEN
jgi:beta-lactamase regulating signal transducer with metallopeptidase domain